MTGSQSVSLETIEELAERWRHEMAQLAGSAGEHEAAEAFEQCAYELERAIDDDVEREGNK